MHVYYRICPGRYLGEASVFIAIATILHVLTIKKMKDEGDWEKALTSNTEGTGYEYDEALNSGADAEFESCS